MYQCRAMLGQKAPQFSPISDGRLGHAEQGTAALGEPSDFGFGGQMMVASSSWYLCGLSPLASPLTDASAAY
jgi:hypothetical protein